MTLCAGAMNKQIQLQVLTNTSDAGGVNTESWDNVANGLVWAEFKSQETREFYRARQVNNEVTHVLTIRFFAGLTPSHRFVFDGRNFNILSAINVNEFGEETQLIAREII